MSRQIRPGAITFRQEPRPPRRMRPGLECGDVGSTAGWESLGPSLWLRSSNVDSHGCAAWDHSAERKPENHETPPVEGLTEAAEKWLPRYGVMVTTLVALTGAYPLSEHVAVTVYVFAAQLLPHG